MANLEGCHRLRHSAALIPGTIHLSNLCTEITLPEDENNIATCNLVDMNLSAFLNADKTWDWDRLAVSVRSATRQLDNLIDITNTPIAKLCIVMSIIGRSGSAIWVYRTVLEKLRLATKARLPTIWLTSPSDLSAYHAIDESANLATERQQLSELCWQRLEQGLLPIDTVDKLTTERGVKVKIDSKSRLDWEALRQKSKRHVTQLMAIAPTANISHVAGTTPGLDPQFIKIFSRSTLNGKFLEVNANLVRKLKQLNLWESLKDDLLANQGDIQGFEQIPQAVRDVYQT